jgi:2'-hydroxyisoflavone reductase
MIAPGSPSDPVQWIDVRDLAEWIVRCIEQKTMGVFLATGPTAPGSIGEIVDSSIRIAKQDGAGKSPNTTPGAEKSVDTTAVWIPADFLGSQGAGPGQFPIWIPPQGEYAGFHKWNNSKAVAAGLKFRALDDTLHGINRWVELIRIAVDPRAALLPPKWPRGSSGEKVAPV